MDREEREEALQDTYEDVSDVDRCGRFELRFRSRTGVCGRGILGFSFFGTHFARLKMREIKSRGYSRRHNRAKCQGDLFTFSGKHIEHSALGCCRCGGFPRMTDDEGQQQQQQPCGEE